MLLDLLYNKNINLHKKRKINLSLLYMATFYEL